jgi:hypothetical protein
MTQEFNIILYGKIKELKLTQMHVVTGHAKRQIIPA